MNKVDITPGVSMLAVLRHLNYKPWYALGEFVDNAVDSFVRHRNELKAIHGESVKLIVSIDIDTALPARILIRDNAAGIFANEYERAFRPAAIPPERTGLSEFGMGMKSSACWFSPKWTVRTSAMGEPVARTICFDISSIVTDNIRELSIFEEPEDELSHYTEIILEDVFHPPVGRTVNKLKEHLSDIYRDFIRNEILELRFNGEILTYEEPQILNAKYFRDDNGPIIEWKKNIEFDFGNGLSVHGFAALRETANTARAGFSLFRRGRVIQGSGDEGYRPSLIFGTSNSYRYQRLFGELHLEGFEVSHTKDGFRWDENEQPFLELLREHLDSTDMPLLRQAEGYRVRATQAQLIRAAQQAISSTTHTMEERLPEVIPVVERAVPVATPTEVPPSTAPLAGRQFDLRIRDKNWSIYVELTNDPSESDWLVVSDTTGFSVDPRVMRIRVSMAHPFMVRFAHNNAEDTDALLRVAAAVALAEVLARDSGVRFAGTVRRNINEILRDALSHA